MNIVLFVAAMGLGPAQKQPLIFQDLFDVRKSDLAHLGASTYFILQPGHTLVLEGKNAKLVVKVLNATEFVDGVVTRVVEERETENGKLIEVSRNFFAIDPSKGDVYYFGEDADMYEDGKVVSHEGAWRSGVKGARFGLMIPGKPQVGQAYYQEIAPKVAMDRAQILGFVSYRTPAGMFSNVLQTEESTPLEPGVKESKHYAPGIGLIQDGSLMLVKKP